MTTHESESHPEWTAKRMVAVVLEVLREQSSIHDIAQNHHLEVRVIEEWRNLFMVGGENALRFWNVSGEAWNQKKPKHLGRKGRDDEILFTFHGAWRTFWWEVQRLRKPCVEELEKLAPDYVRKRDEGAEHHLGGPFPEDPWWQEFIASWAARWNLDAPGALQEARDHLEDYSIENRARLSPGNPRLENLAKGTQQRDEFFNSLKERILPPAPRRSPEDWRLRLRAAMDLDEPVFFFMGQWDPREEGKKQARERLLDRFNEELVHYYHDVQRRYSEPERYLFPSADEYVTLFVRRVVPLEPFGKGETHARTAGHLDLSDSDDPEAKSNSISQNSRKTKELAKFLGAYHLLR